MSVNFRKMIKSINVEKVLIKMEMLYMNGEDPYDNPIIPPIDNKISYFKQRYRYINPQSNPYRYIHKGIENIKYTPGRHDLKMEIIDKDSKILIIQKEFYICNIFTIFPECINRKIKIQENIPQYDKDSGLGWHHLLNYNQQVDNIKNIKNYNLSF